VDDEMAMSDDRTIYDQRENASWVKRVWLAVRWDGTMIAPAGSLFATISSCKTPVLNSLNQEPHSIN
jgi:hypothetical protein